MRKTNNWWLLVRYLAGECTEHEEKKVQALIAVDDEAGELLEELRCIWDASEDSTEELLDDDVAWQMLNRRMQQSESATSILRKVDSSRTAKPRDVSPSRPTRRRRSSHSWRGVAAVLVAAVLVGVLTVPVLSPTSPADSVAVEVVQTRKGQRSLIRLPDGTKVSLNADSRLTLPAEGFTAHERKVLLEGEAYFEVAEDTSRPFLVRARNSSVRVLGTAFDVQAYSDEETVEVAVAEGEVVLRPKSSEGSDTTVVLKPKYRGVVSAAGVLRVHKGADLTPYLAWTKGRLVFIEAPFDEVARRLERWYDLRISVESSVAGIDRLDATFKDVAADHVLSAIATALDLQYTKDRRKVTFYR